MANYSSATAWGTSYNASKQIPANFISQLNYLAAIFATTPLYATGGNTINLHSLTFPNISSATRSGLGTGAYATISNYLTTSSAASTYQPALTNPLVAGTLTNGDLCTKNSSTNTIDCNTAMYVTMPSETDGNIIYGASGSWAKGTAIPNGVTATTQPSYDNSTKVATTAQVQSAIQLTMATMPLSNISGGTYSFASAGSGLNIGVLVTGGVITGYSGINSAGSGFAVGDLVIIQGGNHDAVLRVATLSGSGVASLTVLYGGTGYSNGSTPGADAASSVPFTFLLSGTLTSNATFILQNGTYLTQSNQWIVANNTTGSYTTTFCVSGGSDSCSGGRTVVVPQGTTNSRSVGIQTDGSSNVDLWAVRDINDLTGTTPTWNQSSTGSAASLSISGQTGLMTVTGLTSTNRAKTVRDAADTLLELGGSYTPTGTWTFSNNVTAPAFISNAADGTHYILPYNSIAFSGTPSTGMIQTNSSGLQWYNGSAWATFALLASPTFTGTPAAPTASTGTNSTQIATTAYVDQGPYVLVKTSGSPFTMAATSGMYYNNTSGAYSWDLPTPTAGLQFCFGNYGTKAYALSLIPPTSTYIVYNGALGTVASSTGLVSGGAATDFICLVATDTTHYQATSLGVGTWTNH